MRTLLVLPASAVGVGGLVAAAAWFNGAGTPVPTRYAAVVPPDEPPAVAVGGVPISAEQAGVPKELSPAVRNGLEYLAKTQQPDGGWSQGGGWRTGTGGGRVEGAAVADPSDLGNTCFALLALLRGGHTPTAGEHADRVRRGLAFVLERVERADADSLYVTDVRNTQLQSKIGPYADTFLAGLVLAEFRGAGGPLEERMAAGLTKTLAKVVRHQTADGRFAGNHGWAPTLSVGLATKCLARARERGVKVDDAALHRAYAEAVRASGPADAPAGAVAAAGPDGKSTGMADRFGGAGVGGGGIRGGIGGGGFGGGFGGGGMGGMAGEGGATPGMGGGFGGGDAGVALYGRGRAAGNTQEVLNAMRVDEAAVAKLAFAPGATADQKAAAAARKAAVRTAEAENDRVQKALAASVKDDAFVKGFGSNGGEEFLSFLSISETLLLKGGTAWADWDGRMARGLEKAQDKDGSWQGHHCVTGKTFCTAAALLVLMADRTPFAPEVLAAAREKRASDEAKK